MKKIGMSLILTMLTVTAYSQVALTSDLSTSRVLGYSHYCGTYSPLEDVFISSGSTSITTSLGTTGAFDQEMDVSGIVAGGLGFFAIAAGDDGSIIAYDNADGNLWKWTSKSSAPALAYDGSTTAAMFARCAVITGTGAGQLMALTGSANQGPIQIFSTSDGVTFSELEVVPAAAARAKSTLAMNAAMTVSYSAGDVNNPVRKGVKTGGVWAPDDTFVSAAGNNAGCVYDDNNNVVFTIDGGGGLIQALDGDTGAELGRLNISVNNGANATEGYDGAQITSTAGVGGTVWFCNRGFGTTGSSAFNKVSFIMAPANVPDWTLF